MYHNEKLVYSLVPLKVPYRITVHLRICKMAASKELTIIQEQESVFSLWCKSEIRQVDLCKVSEGENMNDLRNLREDMEELNDLLKSAIFTSVKKVILATDQ
jgi:hypothetical protein